MDQWLLPSVLLQHKQNYYLLLILCLFASFLFVFSHLVVCLATCLSIEAARSKLRNAESDFIYRASLWADTHPVAQPIKQLVMLQPQDIKLTSESHRWLHWEIIIQQLAPTKDCDWTKGISWVLIQSTTPRRLITSITLLHRCCQLLFIMQTVGHHCDEPLTIVPVN